MLATDTVHPDERTTLAEFTPNDLTPAAFSHPVVRLEVQATHISWIVLTGPYAYKIKKNVRFDFLDASTLERRRDLCAEELRLNRRLAGDIYLDVVPITREAGSLRVGGQGQAVEYAVRMKQFDAAQELPALLARGAVSSDELIDLAVRLAEFHRQAPAAPAGRDFPHTQQLCEAVRGNLALLLSHLDAQTLLPEMGTLVDWTHDNLHDSLDALRSREQHGAIRECHGDLHARNIVRWSGRLVPFDCLEFDPKLRWIDVMNDIAFLVMDLTAHERTDLAFAFLNAYVERTGDYAGLRHLGFYAVYRALVRAMVDSLAAEQAPAQRLELHARLRARIKAAWSYVDRPRSALIIMHGLSGSGKSWLTEQLIAPLAAIRIRSDVERKRMAEVSADCVPGDFGQGLYSPEMTRRTYARLLECAESSLEGGINTIVDAAFLTRSSRRSFQELAARHGSTFTILSCQADHATMARRLKERAQRRTDPSDADAAILARQSRIAEPLDDEERASTILIDTTNPNESNNALAAIRCRQSTQVST
jgi:aminoglycoside phosphotransferase family enzyme/predicted kinase